MSIAKQQHCYDGTISNNQQSAIVREYIFEAMVLSRAIENGQITCHQIVDILDEIRNGIWEDVQAQLELIRAEPVINCQGTVDAVATGNGGGQHWKL